MGQKGSNLDRLAAAGLIKDKDKLSPELVEQINDLSVEEVSSIISVRQSLGLSGEINYGVQPSAY